MNKIISNNYINFFDNNELMNLPYTLDPIKNVYNYISVNSKPANTNYSIPENEIMENRLLELKSKKSALLISLLKFDDVELGYKSQSIRLIEEQLSINRIATINWINDLYIENLKDEKVTIGILKIFEYFEESIFSPMSYTIAMSSLLSSNNEIKELAVRTFENWGSIKSYEILKTISTDTQWLKSYIEKVILDLEVELCLS